MVFNLLYKNIILCERSDIYLMVKVYFKNFVNAVVKIRKTTILIVFLLLLIIYMAAFVSPKIYAIAQLQEVTDKDYVAFLSDSDVSSIKKTRDNCRYISIRFKVVAPILLIRDVKFQRVNLKDYLDETQYINETDEILFMGNYNYNINNEFFDGIDVYLDGMTDEKLKDFFGDYKIEVTWANVFNTHYKKVIYLKDCFE